MTIINMTLLSGNDSPVVDDDAGTGTQDGGLADAGSNADDAGSNANDCDAGAGCAALWMTIINTTLLSGSDSPAVDGDAGIGDSGTSTSSP
jgi:hypothetical protein